MTRWHLRRLQAFQNHLTADEMADYTRLRPKTEAEIKYAESGGLLRHAEFVALREA